MVPCGRFRRCARRGRRAWAGRRCSPSRSVPQSPVSACTPSCRFRGRASKRRAWGEPEKRARLENNRGHALASRSPGRVGMRERAHLVGCAAHCAMKSETRCERRGRGWPSASLSSSRESSSSMNLPKGSKGPTLYRLGLTARTLPPAGVLLRRYLSIGARDRWCMNVHGGKSSGTRTRAGLPAIAPARARRAGSGSSPGTEWLFPSKRPPCLSWPSRATGPVFI